MRHLHGVKPSGAISKPRLATYPLIFCSLIFALCGCAPSYSDRPMGTAPALLKATEWDGTWISGKGDVLFLKVVDGEGGQVDVGHFFEKENRLVPQVIECFVYEFENRLFISGVDPERPASYLWALMSREGSQVLMWVPSQDGLVEMIKDGQVPGFVTQAGNPVLTEPREQDLRTIVSAEKTLFAYDQPLAFVRVAPWPR
jgi:hypothetical protein